MKYFAFRAEKYEYVCIWFDNFEKKGTLSRKKGVDMVVVSSYTYL